MEIFGILIDQGCLKPLEQLKTQRSALKVRTMTQIRWFVDLLLFYFLASNSGTQEFSIDTATAGDPSVTITSPQSMMPCHQPALNYNQPNSSNSSNKILQCQNTSTSPPSGWSHGRSHRPIPATPFCLGAGFEYGCQETAQLPAGKNGWVIDCRASGKKYRKTVLNWLISWAR